MRESRTKVMIVDDEEPIHAALGRTLRREPYEILHAYDAAEAYALLEKHPDVAVLVCDHFMPGTRGLDLIAEIRRRRSDIGTVMLTAHADLHMALRAINEGRVHRFFTKPWNADEMRAALRELAGFGVDDEIRRRRDASAERTVTLESELLPPRDRVTGAFIIDGKDL